MPIFQRLLLHQFRSALTSATLPPRSLHAAHTAAAHLTTCGWTPPTFHDLLDQSPAPHHTVPNRRPSHLPARLATPGRRGSPLLLLIRLRFPLLLLERICRCRRVFDPVGPPLSLASNWPPAQRACLLERATPRICREAGARVTTNALLTIPAQRSHHPGVTLPSRGAAGDRNNPRLPIYKHWRTAALQRPTHWKHTERTYPEFFNTGRCRLVVLGVEIGGRFSQEAASFIRSLAHTRARSVPFFLRHITVSALVRFAPKKRRVYRVWRATLERVGPPRRTQLPRGAGRCDAGQMSCAK